jgi:wyosine [tRNA(Phe)-imidazoG37] synthetase (radical SAM superfamily)
LWIEIFVVPGLNDTDSELRKLAEAVNRIRPDRVQINSLDRPGTESWVNTLSGEEYDRISGYFSMCDIIGKPSYKGGNPFISNDTDNEEKIFQLIKRRPCTLDDITDSLGIGKNEAELYLGELEKKHKIIKEMMERGVFYRSH